MKLVTCNDDQSIELFSIYSVISTNNTNSILEIENIPVSGSAFAFYS